MASRLESRLARVERQAGPAAVAGPIDLDDLVREWFRLGGLRFLGRTVALGAAYTGPAPPGEDYETLCALRDGLNRWLAGEPDLVYLPLQAAEGDELAAACAGGRLHMSLTLSGAGEVVRRVPAPNWPHAGATRDPGYGRLSELARFWDVALRCWCEQTEGPYPATLGEARRWLEEVRDGQVRQTA